MCEIARFACGIAQSAQRKCEKRPLLERFLMKNIYKNGALMTVWSYVI